MNISRRTSLTPKVLALGLMMTLPILHIAGSAADDQKLAFLPNDAVVSGTTENTNGKLVAIGEEKKISAKITGAIANNNLPIILKGKTGKVVNGPVPIILSLQGEGHKIELLIRAMDHKANDLPDAYISIGGAGGNSRYYVRPNPSYYNDATMLKKKEEWLKLEPASEHTFTVELRPINGETQIWFNGQFMHSLSTPKPFTSYTVSMLTGATVENLSFGKPTPSNIQSLPIADHGRVGDMTDIQLALDTKANLPTGLNISSGRANGIAIDGLGKVAGIGSGELESLYWRRNATDGLVEQRMFNVPLATYSHAWVLCAAEENPDKVNEFTLRVTRYGGSRGDALADTNVQIPSINAKDSSDARRVGSISYGPANARKSAPLWLIKVPINNGRIQDLLNDPKGKTNNVGTVNYLDVEIMDPLKQVDTDKAFPPILDMRGRTYSPQNHIRMHNFNPTIDLNVLRGTSPRSAVTVFGATLEKSPATIEVRANTDFQVFYKSDNPSWLAKVNAHVPGTYTVQWDFADVDGKIVTTNKKQVTLTTTKLEETVTVPVTEGNGWYATRFRLSDSKGEELIEQRSSFVVLPPDTRKAGFESPFGSWWFHWAHGGEPNIDRVGPLYQRAGLRRSTLPESLPESITKKYGMTIWAVPWKSNRKPTVAENIAEHEAFIQKYQTLWPSAKTILVWHESGSAGAAFPTELWGVTPPPPDEKVEAAWKGRIEYVTALAKMVRAKYPDMKLQYGNDGASYGIVAELLRRKFPREYIDAIASENVGQSISPEKPTHEGLQATWYIREIARTMGYSDLPINATYEWMNRSHVDIGYRAEADWYTRDALHGLAYGFSSIALGTIHDAGNGYFYSTWGSGGLTERYPIMAPKPAYASVATLTRVLDSAKYQGTVPTGSASLYALEFRANNKWIYAMWTPHGIRTSKLQFGTAAPRTLIDTFGRETVQNAATFDYDVTTGAKYVVSDTRITSIVPGKSAFPEDVIPTKSFIVDAMDKADNWAIAAEPDSRFERIQGTRSTEIIPHRTRGNFELREVVDTEKGKCLEVELKPQGDIWKAVHEYALLQLKNPVPAAGPYTHAGVWVKGNGSLGDIMWTLEDDKGAKWSSPTYYQDWPSFNQTNFEGWKFIRLALPAGDKWRKNVKVTGLCVTIPRETLFLTDLIPSPNKTLRFKDLSLF
jgi:hypothetical protein